MCSLSNMKSRQFVIKNDRDKNVQVRLSEAEMQILTRLANNKGISKSSWLRMQIHEGVKNDK